METTLRRLNLDHRRIVYRNVGSSGGCIHFRIFGWFIGPQTRGGWIHGVFGCWECNLSCPGSFIPISGDGHLLLDRCQLWRLHGYESRSDAWMLGTCEIAAPGGLPQWMAPRNGVRRDCGLAHQGVAKLSYYFCLHQYNTFYHFGMFITNYFKFPPANNHFHRNI